MYTKIDVNWQPIGLPASFPPENDNDVWVPLVLPPPRTSEMQVMKFKKENGQCVGYWEGSADPFDRLATNEEINAKRAELEVSPILVNGIKLDCDERSEIRMRDAIAYWDSRIIEPGVFEERKLQNGQKYNVIIWTLADNSSVELTKADLAHVFNEMLIARTNRAAVLFARARKYKTNGITVRHLMDTAYWT